MSFKKFLIYSLMLSLLCAFQCEDEPLEGEFATDDGPNIENCDAAATAVAEALLDFLVATDDNYTELCNAYRDALEVALASCGDEDGSLQVAIDDLGDCTNENSDCADAQASSAEAEDALNNATDDNYSELCEAYINTLFNQIFTCLDPNNELQDIIDELGDCTAPSQGFNCNGLELSEVAGPGFVCDYSATENLTVANVYLEEDYATDEDGDGTDDHYLNRIYLTDGTAALDANNDFDSWTVEPSWFMEIALFSIGTDGLVADEYLPLANVDWQNESYLSVVVSGFSDGPCDPAFFGCDDSFAFIGGIVSVTGGPGNFEICFDIVLDSSNSCINGVYSDFIPIDLP